MTIPRPPVTHLPLESGDCFRWEDVLYLKSKALVLAGAYVILYGLAWCVIWAGKQKIQRTGL